jgi:hypothetical protein
VKKIVATITFDLDHVEPVVTVARDFLFAHRDYTPAAAEETITDAGQGLEELMPFCPVALLAELKDIPTDQLPPRLQYLRRLVRMTNVEMIDWSFEVQS